MFLGSQAHGVSNQENCLPKGFVYLEEIDPSIHQNVEFATERNILGVPADGYEAPRVICTREAALALAKVQKDMQQKGLCLSVWDGYRPLRATKHIQRWAKDLSDQKTKERYYPNISKEEILGTFVAAKRSSHNRGSTFDVILIDAKTRDPLDLGPDTFGEVSFTYSSQITNQQQRNRLMLREAMMNHGFKPYDKEFWHFTLKEEPYPTTYFDFPIK